MKKSLTKALGMLPVILLLVGAANHFYLANTQHLSPWLGGGFGMFASTDVGSTRQVYVTAINSNADEHPVILVGQLEDLQQRARGLPDESQLDILAQATWKELEKEASEEQAPPLTSLRIEVWKTHFDADTLQPQQTQITLKNYDFNKKLTCLKNK